MVSLAARLRASTIRVHLAGIQFVNTILGFDASPFTEDRLRLILRGIQRHQAITLPPRPPRIPISLHHLYTIFRFTAASRTTGDARCFKAALCLAFFGLLRISEFTCPSPTSFDPSLHLSINDIAFSTNPDLLHVRIKQSKTDGFRRGCIVRVARTNNYFCPFDAIVSFLRVHPRCPGPLFTLGDGSFLTRADIQSILRLSFPLVDPAVIGSHSLRIGGASMLCSLGVPDATIQVMGRWSSNAFRRYLRISHEAIARIHSQMAAHACTFSRHWYPDTRQSGPPRDAPRSVDDPSIVGNRR